MFEFDQIKASYPPHLQSFQGEIIREYLQYKILQGIFSSSQASKLSFIGGTALRIVFRGERFSEDIDFDNFQLNWEDFIRMTESTIRFLTLEGYQVESRVIKKGAYHCDLRFLNILFENKISTVEDQKLCIRIDTASQNYEYKPNFRILNRFDVFSGIRVTPIDLLLSMKIFTAVSRKRPKGRDFYDISFLLAQTRPNYGFLNQKMGISCPEELRTVFSESIRDLDFDSLAEDVRPFLIKPHDVERVRLFNEYWQQAEF